jgi:hypothetical protein
MDIRIFVVALFKNLPPERLKVIKMQLEHIDHGNNFDWV